MTTLLIYRTDVRTRGYILLKINAQQLTTALVEPVSANDGVYDRNRHVG
jgi:hypothetical protein